MYTGLIARRYATALYEFAVQGNVENDVYLQVQQLLAYFAVERKLKFAIENPVFPSSGKMEILAKLLGGSINGSLDTFLNLVFSHNREKFLQFMLYSFVDIYKEKHGIMEVKLTTATELDPSVVERIGELVKDKTGSREVEIAQQTDPSVIGGFSLRMDDVLIDDTIASQLQNIKKQLVSKNNRII